MNNKKQPGIWNTVLRAASVYVFLFAGYHIFYKPFSEAAWTSYEVIQFNTPDGYQCELRILYPTHIPTRLLTKKFLTAPFDFRLVCPHLDDTKITKDSAWSLTLSTPNESSIQWLNEDGYTIGNTHPIIPGSSWNTAQPLVLYAVGVVYDQDATTPNTGVPHYLVNANLVDPSGHRFAGQIKIAREKISLTLIKSTLTLLFDNTLFGILGFGLTLYDWRQKDIEQKEEQRKTFEQKLSDAIKTPDRDKNSIAEGLFTLFKNYKGESASLPNYLQHTWEEALAKAKKIPGWQLSLARALASKDYWRKEKTSLEASRLLPPNVIKILQHLYDEQDNEPASNKDQSLKFENLLDFLYFFDLPTLAQLIPKHKDKFRGLFPDEENAWWQASALGRYVAVRYLQKTDVRSNAPLVIQHELDYWFDPDGIVYPLLPPDTKQRPWKAEKDPAIRDHRLFYRHSKWQEIKDNPRANWFICPPGCGTSTFVRMGQHHHRPWGTNQSGFSIYVLWHGPATRANWERLFRQALYRSLQRALLEDPLWFYLAPENLRRSVVQFLDFESPLQNGWKPPSLEAKEMSYLDAEFQRLRQHSRQPLSTNNIPDHWTILQRCFNAIMHYQETTYKVATDPYPWLWVEIPVGATEHNSALEKKVQFLQAEEVIWEQTILKIFMPQKPKEREHVRLPAIIIDWQDEDLKALWDLYKRRLNLEYVEMPSDLDNKTPQELVKYIRKIRNTPKGEYNAT